MLVLILLFRFLYASPLVTRKTYSNYCLISVICTSSDQVEVLESIQQEEIESGNFGVELWQPPSVGSPADVLVSPECLEEFLQELEDNGIQYEVQIADIEKVIAQEIPAAEPGRAKEAAEKFLTLQEVEDFLNETSFRYPQLVQLETIGFSHENRSLILAKIGDQRGKGKPIVWIDAGIHAREWIAPASALYLITKLLTETSLERYLNDFEWHILPVMNPDGYHHSHTVDRMWRKNRRRGPCKCFVWAKYCCDGVDLNRNFDYEFGGTGSSKYPCDNTYRGPSAFSEPESMAVRDYLLRIANDTVLYLTLHSYGQYWIYPYSDRSKSYPDDHVELDILAKNATTALEGVHGSKYQVGTAADLLYPTTGSSADWAKSVAKIKYVYGVELRPGNEKRRRTGFILPPHEISQSGEELWAAIKILLDTISARKS